MKIKCCECRKDIDVHDEFWEFQLECEMCYAWVASRPLCLECEAMVSTEETFCDECKTIKQEAT